MRFIRSTCICNIYRWSDIILWYLSSRPRTKKRRSCFLMRRTVITLYHHNYHMYTVQLSLFQVFPTVIIQTCGFIFCRKFRHLLHYAALFQSTKTMHALASQFASLLGSIWPCTYLFIKEEMKEKKEKMWLSVAFTCMHIIQPHFLNRREALYQIQDLFSI